MAWNVLENMFINQHVSGAHHSWTPWKETKPNMKFPLLFRQEYTIETSIVTAQYQEIRSNITVSGQRNNSRYRDIKFKPIETYFSENGKHDPKESSRKQAL